MEQPTNQREYCGSPIEVGTDVAIDALNPTIMQTIENGVTDQQPVQRSRSTMTNCTRIGDNVTCTTY